MYTYAQLNDGNIAIAITTTFSEISDSKMILITDEESFSVLGKRYNNGNWEEVEIITPPELDYIPYTQQELDYMQCNQIEAQNRYLTKELETTTPTKFSTFNLSENDIEVKKKNKNMYSKGFRNKDFNEITVRRAVLLSEITSDDYEEITGLPY